MKLYYEWGTRQIHKKGEELCGDCMAITRHKDSVTMALSDGLGSGVKANILATLTTHIAMHMLENDLPMNEVIQTLGETLPVCNVRQMAYSTFTIAQFFRSGHARVVEFDAPAAVLLRERRANPLHYEERIVDGKSIREAMVDLVLGDWMVFMSDGVLNAGIGGCYPLGWGWDEAARFLEKHSHPDLSAQDVADKVAEAVDALYTGAPGDDVSVAVIKVRRKQVANVLTGPPAASECDQAAVADFIKRAGRLIVCGGTTAKIVSRFTGRPLEVELNTMTPDVPPVGRIPGIDLVTEGILTLTQVSEMLKGGVDKKAIQFRTDGAADLVRQFLDVDQVHFMVGAAVNPAHQNPELPRQLELRMAVVREIRDALKKRGIEVSIETL
ncbi:MAG: SpoIIE family protein phosphatase [Planctomycetota bacterium]